MIISALFAWIPLNCLDPVEPERQSAYEVQFKISLNNSSEGCQRKSQTAADNIALVHSKLSLKCFNLYFSIKNSSACESCCLLVDPKYWLNSVLLAITNPGAP